MFSKAQDVSILWSYVVKETGVPGRNHGLWTVDHYPAICRHRESTRAAMLSSMGFIPALSRPLFKFQNAEVFTIPQKIRSPDNGQILGVHASFMSVSGYPGQVAHQILGGSVVWWWQLLNHIVDLQQFVVFISYRFLENKNLIVFLMLMLFLRFQS